MLRIQQVNGTGWASTGATVGGSGASYDRQADILTITVVSGATYTGLDFGDIPHGALTGTGQQTALPGLEVFYRHEYFASSAGQAVVTATHSPAMEGWTEAVYLDANSNGVLDAGELPVGGAIEVTAGQVLSFIVRVGIPANASLNARVVGTVTVSTSYSNAVPGLTLTVTATEVTTVGKASDAALALKLAVDKSSALPGTFVLYTVTFTNTGSQPITGLVVRDSTPPYTTFQSASTAGLPALLGTPVVVIPSPGAKGSLTWDFPWAARTDGKRLGDVHGKGRAVERPNRQGGARSAYAP